LTQILQQGTEFDTLAETVLADRFERLVDLMTMQQQTTGGVGTGAVVAVGGVNGANTSGSGAVGGVNTEKKSSIAMTTSNEFPIAMALANVMSSEYMDELARVLVMIFDAKRLLPQLLLQMFTKEVEVADCYQIIFRGNSLASKIMFFCFKIYGSSYLVQLFQPILINLFAPENIFKSYEVNC
jgi:neurofibromin 1